MRQALAVLILIGASAGFSVAQNGRVPVVVELFSSEGCSSCPPADALLNRLERTQPVPGAKIIALEEHVDYWNQLGWNDPFSSPQFRFRQNDYAQLFRIESVYTPQMVVNGQAGFVGGDEGVAFQEISRAASRAGADVQLQAAPNSKNPSLVDLFVKVSNDAGSRGDFDIMLAVTDDRLSSRVDRGENAGRVLRHAPVVRSFGVIGKMNSRKAGEAQFTSTLKFPSDWRRENLRAVVFVQERASRRIAGANIVELR